MEFKIKARLNNKLGRAGTIETAHGVIETPAFVTVGTKATVKSLTPEQVRALGAQVVLANTYHLYFEPGEKILKAAGGLHQFTHWDGPTMTDSGGFQVFSLGVAFGKNITKVAKGEPQEENYNRLGETAHVSPAKIDEEGVTFKSPKDGSEHRFTPERSMEIQHNIGADIIFAFDECTSPTADYDYQKEAMDRTHRWAKRSLDYHRSKNTGQAIFGIVQGGRFEDLRKESAREISKLDFDGFGIGGSFVKEDMGGAVHWVNAALPEEKPRHLLGIGAPEDLFDAVENGCDLFDCVAPTRLARNASLYTSHGKINILNAEYVSDFQPIEKGCGCYTCTNFTKAYLSHLYRSNEILANTLGSNHNLYFIINLVNKMRQAIFDDTFMKLKSDFLASYIR